MLIGVPKEIKVHEYRVGLVPSAVKELASRGHLVCIESKAGESVGFYDEDYINAGAQIKKSASEVFSQAEMIIKVKEPQSQERSMLRDGQIIFTYLHLAPDSNQTNDLIASGVTAIAYETVTDVNGGLPLLAPMSEVAGRLSIQAGASSLEKSKKGRGILLGGVPGVEPAHVMIVGGGVVGVNAATMAVGLGADVSIYDTSISVLRAIDQRFANRVKTIYSTEHSLIEGVTQADLIIGAVLIPGAFAPKVINRGHLKKMKHGAAIVDVAIDQGGCCETSRPTTHDNPTFIVDDVIHYCVANMPGVVARTSTIALNNATLPFVLELADKGLCKAMNNKHLLNGLNVCKGQVTCKHVAEAQNIEHYDAKKALQMLS